MNRQEIKQEIDDRVIKIKRLTNNQDIIEHCDNIGVALTEIPDPLIKYAVIRLYGAMYEDITLFNTKEEADHWTDQDILKEYDSIEAYKEDLESQCGRNMYEYFIEEIEINLNL